MRSVLPCPNCLRQVVYKYLVPQYVKSVIEVINKELTHYLYTCPYCKVESVFYKDAVREIWKEQNPDKPTAIKL